MELLRAHDTGEGNQTQRVADAEQLQDTLQYKSEDAMLFSNFLSKGQKVFVYLSSQVMATLKQ